MNGLKFSEEVARKLERLYLTKDVVAQRSETIKQLSLCQAERVLDVGCGPGFLCESMAEVVGRYRDRRFFFRKAWRARYFSSPGVLRPAFQ